MSNQIIVGLKTACADFEKNYQNTISLIPGGLNELYTKCAAEFTLHPELNSDVEKAMRIFSAQPRESGNLTPYSNVCKARYRLLCQLFLRLRDRDAFSFVVWTDEANEEQLRMEEFLGLRQAPTPPPPPRSAQEILEGQVIADYSQLSSDNFKKKLNGNAAYRDTFDRLSETNRLASRATQLHDGNDFGRVGG